MKKLIIVFICCINIPILSMQHTDATPLCEDLINHIIAASDTCEKNTLRSVCKTFKHLSSKNNLALYQCNPLILSRNQKEYALQFAMYHRNPTAVKNLCSIGAQSSAVIPLATLALYKDPFTLETKQYIQLPNPHYIIASYFGDSDFLQSYCADKNNKINNQLMDDGATALHYAARKGHEACVKLLLTHSNITTIINGKDRNEYTPLHRAIASGHLFITQLLYKHGAIESKSCLFFACFYGREHIVKFLLTQDNCSLDEPANNGNILAITI